MDTFVAWDVLIPLGAYLLGSVLPADHLARYRGVDLRAAGRNPGTGEISRRFGLRPALVVFTLDAGKGALPLLAGRWLGISWWALALAAVAAVTGHNWSIYHRFWGGKGLATAAGVCAVLMPWLTAVVLPPSLLAWWRTGWIPTSGIVGLPLLLLLAWVMPVDPATRAAATIIPFVMLLRQRQWIREWLALRAEQETPGRDHVSGE
jgi:glycerol-3-phosphate acyltransferase PlsY